MPVVDLHTHSEFSDGTASPEEVVFAALKNGVQIYALTDHDTVSGVERFLSAASGTPLHAVPGVELASMLFNKDIHIVGLFIDPGQAGLHGALEQMRLWREERNAEMVKRIRSKGYGITMDEVLASVNLDISGRPYLVFNCEFQRDQIGMMATEMVEEFMRAFAFNAGITLHINLLYGSNDHHKAEAVFKGLGHALKAALKITSDEIPSTKGMLE